jgi:3-oxoacyl-[acyl-carrier-protein] synthase III
MEAFAMGVNMRSVCFGIAGSAAVLPRRVVPSSEIDVLTGLAAGDISRRFGITHRHWAGPDETSSSMAAEAAVAAITEAGWEPDSIDVIIAACGVMEQPIPGTAPLVQRRIGLGDSGIPAFDINATCLSFLMAFDRVMAGFALGEWRRALIVTADIASAALDFTNAEGSAIFGDGATAFALEADGPHQRIAHRFQTYGDGADLCRLEAGGTRLRPEEDLGTFLAKSKFQMDGPGVFRATAKRFPAFLASLLDDAKITGEDIKTIIPHQASATALEHLKRAVPDGHTKTVDIFATIGNQIATSMPHAWHRARQQDRLHTGEHALLIGTSAGVSLGGAVIKW